MITLPYPFDTTLIWKRIVKIAFAIAGVLLFCVVSALLSGKFGGAFGLALATTIFFSLARRVRAFPMGAVGTLTETRVETQPVRILWYSLPVPVGTFSIDRFDAVGVVERLFFPKSGGGATTNGSVQLIGKDGTPDIEVAFRDIDSANVIARELSDLLRLPIKRVDPPGTRSIRVTLG